MKKFFLLATSLFFLLTITSSAQFVREKEKKITNRVVAKISDDDLVVKIPLTHETKMDFKNRKILGSGDNGIYSTDRYAAVISFQESAGGNTQNIFVPYFCNNDTLSVAIPQYLLSKVSKIEKGILENKVEIRLLQAQAVPGKLISNTVSYDTGEWKMISSLPLDAVITGISVWGGKTVKINLKKKEVFAGLIREREIISRLSLGDENSSSIF